MLKAAAGKMAYLGLSHENLRRLKEGQPILINLSELGFEDRPVFIFAGETEESMASELKKRKLKNGN